MPSLKALSRIFIHCPLQQSYKADQHLLASYYYRWRKWRCREVKWAAQGFLGSQWGELEPEALLFFRLASGTSSMGFLSWAIKYKCKHPWTLEIYKNVSESSSLNAKHSSKRMIFPDRYNESHSEFWHENFSLIL